MYLHEEFMLQLHLSIFILFYPPIKIITMHHLQATRRMRASHHHSRRSSVPFPITVGWLSVMLAAHTLNCLATRPFNFNLEISQHESSESIIDGSIYVFMLNIQRT